MRVSADILAVDDDAAIGRLCREILEGEGHRVTVAKDAAEARLLLRQVAFDLVLCDMRMPGESGLSLAAHLASDYPDTAVVMVTALDRREVADTAVGFGAFAYIVKPFRYSELVGAVSSALRRMDLSDAARVERNRLKLELVRREAAATMPARRRHPKARSPRRPA